MAMAMATETDDLNADDVRTPHQVKYDALVDQVNRIAELVAENIQHGQQSQTTTVIHKSAGIGAWGAAAVTACFATMAMLTIFALYVIPELHDLRAWQDINKSHINALEAKQK